MYKDPLEKIYRELFGHTMDLIEEHDVPVEAVAGSLMAIAMRLYKTHLNEKGFLNMIRTVMETEVEPYEKPKRTLN